MRMSKMRVVQTHDEYMTEQHIEEENSSQPDTESSDSDEGLTNSDDDDDNEANVQDENGETTKHRKRKLKDIWNLPKGQRIVVECNDLNQPIGKEAGHLGNFLGTVARNGSLCSLSYTDWRKLIGEKDKNTNEERNKKDILEQVKMRFLYPARMEKYVLRTIGERWRQHKSNLKALHFDANKSMEANNTNVPKGVSKDQWIALVNNWMSQKAQDISEQNRKNCAMKKSTHTAGTKSFARNREELRQKDPEKKNPHRAVLYIHTHQHKSQKNMNEHVDDLKRLLVQQPDLADTSQGKTAWKGDALNKILGVDKPGHVHGLGLVPNPNQVFHVSASRRFQDTHLTSLEDTSSQDILSVRLHIEKLEKHIKNQDAEILELKEKTKNLERPTNQGILDPMCTSRDARCVDGTNSKRKRVYGDSPSQGLGMIERQKDEMSKHNDFHHVDLQPSNERSAADKEPTMVQEDLNIVNKETLVQNDIASQQKKTASAFMNKEISTLHNNALQIHKVSTTHKSKKISTGATATKLSNKQQCCKTNWLGADPIAVGTKVFLKSLKNANKDVALATLVSSDPEYKLDGVALGSEFWAVHVNAALVKCEQLIRPLRNYKIIGNAVGTKIAWPSTFIDKING